MNNENSPHIYPSSCYFKTLEDIKDKNVTIMGLGLNGGGEASVRFFLKHGAKVLVTDMKTENELAPTIQRLRQDSTLDLSRLDLVLGMHREQDFANADCVIKNPGVRFEGNRFLALAKAVETDLSIFLHFCKSPIIAVTGSKGKSSTVSAIHYGLKAAGFNAFLGGNITVSPLSFLEQTDETTPVVIEFSSWQLRDLRGRNVLHPKVAIITKIVSDHQNWYHSMSSYVEDKKIIFEGLNEDSTAIFASGKEAAGNTEVPQGFSDWGDVFAKQLALSSSAKILRSSYALLESDAAAVKFGDLKVPGRHNRLNVYNAALVLTLMGISREKAATIMEQWPGIEHRLEFFFQKDNVLFYNDSAATVPEAAAAALYAFNEKIVFIGGGTDKDLDFTPMANTLCKKDGTEPKQIFLLEGTGTQKLTKLLEEKNCSYRGPFKNLKELLLSLKEWLAEQSADEKQIVVFSPGCTSFGMFKNEFDRGMQFKSLVQEEFRS